jgi:hypothetical protein
MKTLLQVILLSSLIQIAWSNTKELEERIEYLENQVTDLEINSLLNKIKWSGDFSTQYDYYNSKNSAPKELLFERPRKRIFGLWSNELFLNANANVHKRIGIYTSLRSAFYYNESLLNSRDVQDSLVDSKTTSYIQVNKAYADIDLVSSKSLIFSIGRLPTTSGPPVHFYSDKRRMGTYPLVAYSVPLDGLALTWNSQYTFGLKDDLVFRFIYTPTSIADYSNPAFGVQGSSTKNYSDLINGSEIYHLMAEYRTKRAKWTDDFSLIGQALRYTQGRIIPFETRAVLNAQTLEQSSGTIQDTNLYEVYSDNEKLLSVKSFNLHIEGDGLFGSGLGLYASYKRSHIERKGTLKIVVLEDNVNDQASSTVGNVTDIGGYILGGDKSEWGGTRLLGARYRFNDKFSLGAEHIHGTYGSIPTIFQPYAVQGFYNTVGTGFHNYVNWNVFGETMKLRFGYYYREEKKAFQIVSYVNRERDVHNAYSRLEINF